MEGIVADEISIVRLFGSTRSDGTGRRWTRMKQRESDQEIGGGGGSDGARERGRFWEGEGRGRAEAE